MPPVGNRNRILGTVNDEVDAKARGFARALQAWLLRIAVEEARAAVADLKRQGPRKLAKHLEHGEPWLPWLELAKANGDKFEGQGRRLLQTFGLRMLQDSANGASEIVAGRGTKVVLPSSTVDSFMSTKEVRLQQILRRTRADTRNSVKDLIRAALQESPQPSAGEIARRIRTQFHGTPGEGGRITGVVREGSDKPPGLLTTDRVSTDVPVSGSQGILYAFSSERAALIARTELGQAANTGIFEGYKVSGVQELEWLAITSDFRSGSRRHWEMDGKKVKIGEKFRLPDGARMRYPHDPAGPIRHLANCRCTHRPVLVRRRRPTRKAHPHGSTAWPAAAA